MRRREVITLLGGAAAAWPLAARAQQSGRLPTIGFLGANTPDAQARWTAVFVQRLRELGWIEGRTVAIEYRWAEGSPERSAEIAQEFVRLKVDVIFASGGTAVLAVKQATSAIPIVFPAAGDPVGSGLVASLARPGGNVTGMSIQQIDLASKRLELLREVLPELRRLAVMAHVVAPVVRLEIDEIRAAAGRLGLEIAVLEIRRTEDIMSALDFDQGAGECALRHYRSTPVHQPAAHQYAGAWNSDADDPRLSRVCPSRGADVLWAKLPRPVPTLRRLGRQDSAGDQAKRYPGRAADQIRLRDQSHHRQGARPHRAGYPARPCRRGD